MTKFETITSPSGDKLAVLPLAELELLLEAVEDAEDVRAYDAAMRRLDAGEDEIVPGHIAKRLIAGESPVRVWREHRGLSAKQLAAAAAISAPYLSQIEIGKRKGQLEVMLRIATALRLKIDDLV